MEEATEETEAAAAATARRARYAHLLNVYELHFERALRQAECSRNRVKVPSAPQASFRRSRRRIARPVSRLSDVPGLVEIV